MISNIYNLVSRTHHEMATDDYIRVKSMVQKNDFGVPNLDFGISCLELADKNNDPGVGSYFGLSIIRFDADVAEEYLRKFADKNCFCSFVYGSTIVGSFLEEAIEWLEFSAEKGSIPAELKLLELRSKQAFIKEKYLKLKLLRMAVNDRTDVRIKKFI